MNTLKNLPANHPIYEILSLPRPVPKFSEAVKAIRAILDSDIPGDWSITHAAIEKYFELNNIVTVDTFELASTYCLNAMKVDIETIEYFLLSETETYAA